MVGYAFTWLQEAGRPDRWETVHGFYVGMGGLAIDLDNSFIRNKHKSGAFRATLTASGASFLAKCDLLPPVKDIAKDFISDKSKADDFAKFLVCVQAAWCFLQYIGRVAGHLPVTLLEVNTLGHALCAIAIYACWWKKPFDIKRPFLISVPTNLCAYMWMCSSISCGTLDVHHRLEECRYVGLSGRGTNIDDQSAPIEYQHIDYRPVELRRGQDLPGTRFHFNYLIFGEHRGGRWVEMRHTFSLQREDVWRWKLANEALSQYGELIHINGNCGPLH